MTLRYSLRNQKITIELGLFFSYKPAFWLIMSQIRQFLRFKVNSTVFQHIYRGEKNYLIPEIEPLTV